jgi:hypothetical protein
MNEWVRQGEGGTLCWIITRQQKKQPPFVNSVGWWWWALLLQLEEQSEGLGGTLQILTQARDVENILHIRILHVRSEMIICWLKVCVHLRHDLRYDLWFGACVIMTTHSLALTWWRRHRIAGQIAGRIAGHDAGGHCNAAANFKPSRISMFIT